ncbi:hypothetical protein OJ996_20045 [Luteolibacter sp. GHJ8]|uniref:DUF4398 domain-containing protein n=1 Tax=Luteolibacter rhizosphaerae TaxID=2989719 RepID=A0ABT3G9L1_9BACT|nr:hypothetical protein [Luteolibacter rhizosphaerae]MCW1915890.1 hypothetical protein [Luteolibacter rhizosphaerae]
MLTLGLSSLLVSCGEDPELKLRRETQTRRIVEMEARIAVLRERMRTPVPDNSSGLEAARRASEVAQEGVREKEQELALLESAVQRAEQELADFERKHKISGKAPR